MAKKPDFRKEIRAGLNAAQDANARRLIAGQTVKGGSVAPRKASAPARKGRAKRVRTLGGIRLSTKDLQSSPGVEDGDMLRDLTRRGNVKVGRRGGKIVPSPGQILKVRVFQAGNRKTGQPPRPISGIDGALLATIGASVARSGRDQIVRNLKNRPKV